MTTDNKESKDNYVKPPSFFEMVKTFTKEVTKYIANGAPNVTTEDYVDRLEVCEGCEHYIQKSARCGKCGCLMEHKAKWKTSDCPINKWKKQVLTKEQKKVLDESEAKQDTSQDTPQITQGEVTYKKYTKEEFEELKKENAKRQKDTNTDSSNEA